MKHPPAAVDPRARALWMGVKRALGVLVAAIDEYFGIESSGR